MKPMDIACRSCAAQPNEPCDWQCGFDFDVEKDHPGFHHERIEDAVAMSDGPSTPKEQEEVDVAIESTANNML